MRFPRIMLERRLTAPRYWKFLTPLLAVAVTFVIISVFILASKANVASAYGSLFSGFFGSSFAISEMLVRATPLIFMGTAGVIAFRTGFWNIGLEGQFYAGALLATWAAYSFGWLGSIALSLVILFGFLGGMLCALVPAVLKIKLGVSEVLVTLMMNYVIQYIVNYVLFGPWLDPIEHWPVSPPIPLSTYFPKIGFYRLHLGFFIAIACALLAYIFINHTTLGFELKSVGESLEASRAAGINTKSCILVAALLSGGIAGISGANEVAGIHYRMRLNLSPGYGWTGIAVSWLARLDPLGVLLTAVFFGGLINGGTAVQQTVDIPSSIIDVMQALIIISVLAFELLSNYKIRIRW